MIDTKACIDVWNPGTFDDELVALLDRQASALTSYFEAEYRIIRTHDLSNDPDKPILRPPNPYTVGFYELSDAASRWMEVRNIRAYHYTRMTDAELLELRSNGVHMSTPDSLQRRLDTLVTEGLLTQDAADRLYNESPLQRGQLETRGGRFWLVSHPLEIDDPGVTSLLAYWGGEVANMWIRDTPLLDELRLIGLPRIIEVAVPLAATNHASRAAEAVTAAYARGLGAPAPQCAFDLYAMADLPADAVLGVHSQGDETFDAMGRTYPAGLIDVPDL